ncbi:MAG: hypothetical protein PHW08_00355 [Kiritimatiellae bacterium]|nr:hypothetical protein [Kiritimatiellia bacterium]
MEPTQPELQFLAESMKRAADTVREARRAHRAEQASVAQPDPSRNEPLERSFPLAHPVAPVEKWLRELLSQKRVVQYEIKREFEEDGETAYPTLVVSYASSGFWGFDLVFFLRRHFGCWLYRNGWWVEEEWWEVVEFRGSCFSIRAYCLAPMRSIEKARMSHFARSVVDGTPDGMFYHAANSKAADRIEKEGLLTRRPRIKVPVHLFKDAPIVKDMAAVSPPEKLYLFTNLNDLRESIVELMALENHREASGDDPGSDRRGTGTSPHQGGQSSGTEAACQDSSPGMTIYFVDLKRMLDDELPVMLYPDARFGETKGVYFTRQTIPPAYVKRGEVLS